MCLMFKDLDNKIKNTILKNKNIKLKMINLNSNKKNKIISNNNNDYNNLILNNKNKILNDY